MAFISHTEAMGIYWSLEVVTDITLIYLHASINGRITRAKKLAPLRCSVLQRSYGLLILLKIFYDCHKCMLTVYKAKC